MHTGMNKLKNIEFLSGSSLKIIAMITMLIDHIGATLFPEFTFLRVIGRLSFPIFCFLLAEGAQHTKDIKKYAIRLLCFAFISEIPFDLAFSGQWISLDAQNVFFTLFFGLLAIVVLEKYKQSPLVSLLVAVVAELLNTDYGMMGVLFILLFYYFRENKSYRLASVGIMNLIGYFGTMQMFASLAVVLLSFYNGERGYKIKYLFYAFYPLHLLILFYIQVLYK